MEELDWLREKQDAWIAQGTDPGLTVCWVDFQGERAIWLYSPIFSSFPNLYTCEGQRLEINPSDHEALEGFSKMLQNKTMCDHLIWASPNASFCK